MRSIKGGFKPSERSISSREREESSQRISLKTKPLFWPHFRHIKHFLFSLFLSGGQWEESLEIFSSISHSLEKKLCVCAQNTYKINIYLGKNTWSTLFIFQGGWGDCREGWHSLMDPSCLFGLPNGYSSGSRGLPHSCSRAVGPEIKRIPPRLSRRSVAQIAPFPAENALRGTKGKKWRIFKAKMFD